MTNKSIVFYQSRDTNAIISTAFQLFQDRFGEIAKIFLVTIFPFSLIVFMLTNYIQASTMADVTDQQGFFASADYWLMLGLTMLVAIFFSTLMLGIIASYFRALADNTARDIATLVRSALQLWFRYTIVGILFVPYFLRRTHFTHHPGNLPRHESGTYQCNCCFRKGQCVAGHLTQLQADQRQLVEHLSHCHRLVDHRHHHWYSLLNTTAPRPWPGNVFQSR
jgi:hypothetical protein